MGKKGSKRKTRWRTLSIGGEYSACSRLRSLLPVRRLFSPHPPRVISCNIFLRAASDSARAAKRATGHRSTRRARERESDETSGEREAKKERKKRAIALSRRDSFQEFLLSLLLVVSVCPRVSFIEGASLEGVKKAETTDSLNRERRENFTT